MATEAISPIPPINSAASFPEKQKAINVTTPKLAARQQKKNKKIVVTMTILTPIDSIGNTFSLSSSGFYFIYPATNVVRNALEKIPIV